MGARIGEKAAIGSCAVRMGKAHAGRTSSPGWREAVTLGAVFLLGLAATGVVALGWSGTIDQVEIDAPALVLVVSGLTGLGLIAGVADRPRRWWSSFGIGIAATATVVVAAAHWWVSASGLVADHYPPSVLIWTWLGVWAVGVGTSGWWSGTPLNRFVRVVCAPLALFAAFLLVNEHYGYWPTVGSLLDRPVPGQVSSSELDRAISGRTGATPSAADARLLDAGRRTGLYGPVALTPGPVPFAAAPTWVWLPPAYFERPQSQLPVLVMLTGLPGAARDWATAGQVIPVAEHWADRHEGIAPVMVFVDENGRGNRDTECVNGPQGMAASYLNQDLPLSINRALGLTPDPFRWGIVGFSEGGTCAVDLATQAPGVFGTFVDVAGDSGPSLGSPEVTLRRLYGGDAALARSFQTELVLSSHRVDHVNGWFAAGRGDHSGSVAMDQLSFLAARSGVHVQRFEGPGGHTWRFARTAFAYLYPDLATSLWAPPDR